MSDPDFLVLAVLLAACVFFLFLLLLAVFRAGSSLQRLERLLEVKSDAADDAARAVVAAEPSIRGAFRRFLAEDPERRKLSKSEQFSAYRRWRREQGLNWSKP